MQSQSIFKGWFLWVITALAVLGFGGWFVIFKAHLSRVSIDVYGEVPPFAFTAHTGETFGLINMKGHISVVDFIFTTCETACPIMTSQMKELYRYFEGSDKIGFVSFTVDPDVDTIPVLQEYAAKLGVSGDRWTFVRAPAGDIEQLSEKGFYLPAEDLPMGHSTKFVLVDQEGKIRGYYDSLDDDKLNALKKQIQELADQLQ